jgi:putative membrane protein
MPELPSNDGLSNAQPAPEVRPLPLLRCTMAGLLMGLANLVPGVSGGTMILVMGLYEDFIAAIAEITRLRLRRRSILFLAIIVGAAAVAIAALAGTLSRAVTLHPSAMFSLFIGLTLGGAPLLLKMLRPVRWPAVVGMLVGLGLMVVIAATREEPPEKDAIREAARRGEVVVHADYGLDVAAGVLGMSAMVLPGISGAYMLLVLNRYEAILAAIALARSYILSGGQDGSPRVFLAVLIPTAIGAVIGLVALSNLLKWMLQRHEKPTLGLLLGILLGSVIGIWPFGAESKGVDYLLGLALAAGGLLFTSMLSRFAR